MMKEPWHPIVIWIEKTIILLKMPMMFASSEYVPCENYPNDKVYPEDEKNVWVRLDEDTGPPYIDLRDLVKTTWIYMNSLQVQFLMSFLKIEFRQY